MQLISLAGVTIDERKQATRYLRGEGIEIGASHMPIEVDKTCCSVRYVDRLNEGEIDQNFPELRESTLVPVDVICDVVNDGLSPFADGSLDFAIASHLLEHVPNPLGFIQECHRVLRAGGYLYLGIPDKEFTFDRDRKRTPLAHLIADFRAGARAIDEEHLVDYLTKAAKEAIPEDPAARTALFERELGRSFHVHVWTWEDMVELIQYTVTELKLDWDLAELFLPKGVKNEAIFILKRSGVDAGTAANRFASNLKLLLDRERAAEQTIALARKGIEAMELDAPHGNGHRSLLSRLRNKFTLSGKRSG